MISFNSSRKKVGLKLAAAAIGTALVLSGCAAGGGAEEPAGDVELRFAWWGSDTRHEITNKVLDLFEEQNPGITVARDFGGFDGYRDKLLTQFAGGNPPDVFQLYDEVLREFVDRGQLLDLQTVIPDPLSLDGWPDNFVESGTVDGTLGALQFGLTTQAIVWNEDLMKQYGVEVPGEGWTWDDYAKTAAAVTAASGGSVFGTTDLSGGYQAFEVWAKQKGEDYLDGDGLAFTAKTLESYWDYWTEMRASGAATPADVTAETPTPYDIFIAGKSASAFIMANQFGGVTSSVATPVGMTRMPGEAKTPGQYLRTSMSIAAAANSKHPEEAAKLINFLLNNKEALAILGTERGVPANANVIEAATASLDATGKASVEMIESVRANGATPVVPAPPGAGNVNLLFAEIAQQVAFGQVTVKDGVADFMKRAPEELG